MTRRDCIRQYCKLAALSRSFSKAQGPKSCFLLRDATTEGPSSNQAHLYETVESESCQGSCNCLRCNGHERCYRPGWATVSFVLIIYIYVHWIPQAAVQQGIHFCTGGCCRLQFCIELGSQQWDWRSVATLQLISFDAQMCKKLHEDVLGMLIF